MPKHDYDVGYGKPPKSGQFKKGQSGNPKGRKPKSRWRKTTDQKDLELIDAMHSKVTVRENGEAVQMEAVQALYRQLIAKALKGDYRTSKMLVEHYHAGIERDEEKRLSLAKTVFDMQRRIEEDAEQTAKENARKRADQYR